MSVPYLVDIEVVSDFAWDVLYLPYAEISNDFVKVIQLFDEAWDAAEVIAPDVPDLKLAYSKLNDALEIIDRLGFGYVESEMKLLRHSRMLLLEALVSVSRKYIC